MLATLKKDYNNVVELNKSLACSNQALSLNL